MVESRCGLNEHAHIEHTSPELTPAGKTKVCATCECRQAVVDWHRHYASCDSSDADWQGESYNAALAKNATATVLDCK